MLKLKLQYFGHLMQKTNSLEKSPDAGQDWRQKEKGTTEDEMAGWHHWVDGHESEWTPGVGDGQGGLACCDSWTWLREWTKLNWVCLLIAYLKFVPPCLPISFGNLLAATLGITDKWMHSRSAQSPNILVTGSVLSSFPPGWTEELPFPFIKFSATM